MPQAFTHVLDASAAIAFLKGELGADRVAELLASENSRSPPPNATRACARVCYLPSRPAPSWKSWHSRLRRLAAGEGRQSLHGLRCHPGRPGTVRSRPRACPGPPRDPAEEALAQPPTPGLGSRTAGGCHHAGEPDVRPRRRTYREEGARAERRRSRATRRRVGRHAAPQLAQLGRGRAPAASSSGGACARGRRAARARAPLHRVDRGLHQLSAGGNRRGDPLPLSTDSPQHT